jgi:hypothetical protein
MRTNFVNPGGPQSKDRLFGTPQAPIVHNAPTRKQDDKIVRQRGSAGQVLNIRAIASAFFTTPRRSDILSFPKIKCLRHHPTVLTSAPLILSKLHYVVITGRPNVRQAMMPIPPYSHPSP